MKPYIVASMESYKIQEKRMRIMQIAKVMVMTVTLLGLFPGSAVAAVTSNDSNCANPDPTKNWYEGTWICPDEATIPNNAEGEDIRYGKELLTQTYKYLSQLGVTPNYATGNRLSCTNCHLEEGRAAYSGGWAVVYYKYGGGDEHVPATKGSYSARINQYLSNTGRIQDCLQRSMNAQTNVLSPDSREMRSMIAYMKWLSTGVQWADKGGPVTDWRQVKGQGFLSLPLMTRAANPVRGQTLYEENCAACHGSDGEGLWNPDTQTYIFPAVWGPRSFNTGAGMWRMLTGTRFIKGNMPYGWANASDPTRQLSVEDTYDVMAYTVYSDRPVWWNYLNDWLCQPVGGRACDKIVNGVAIGPDGTPDWMRKPPDTGYPVFYPRWDGGHYTQDTVYPAVFTEDKHKYGPWKDMLDLQTKIIADFKLCGRSPCP